MSVWARPNVAVAKRQLMMPTAEQRVNASVESARCARRYAIDKRDEMHPGVKQPRLAKSSAAGKDNGGRKANKAGVSTARLSIALRWLSKPNGRTNKMTFSPRLESKSY